MVHQLRVVPQPVLADNYVYVLVAPGSAAVAIVDPGEAAPVLELLERERWRLEIVLLTHHHGDHVAGVEALGARFPGLRVVGAERDRARLPRLTASVRENDVVAVLGCEARAIEVPGHTRGHIAWFIPDGAAGGDLFSGDTVFGGTIGNLFEGTPDDMFGSLQKLRALPAATRLWCGHEYTLRYVRDAAAFDPGNARLAARLRRLEAAGENAVHVPLLMEEEVATNPFFRWDDPGLAARLGTAPGIETFRKLCDVL
jgi:hydroxyacylglutathione hydrolase